MRWIISFIFLLAMLAGTARAQDGTVIDMPPPPAKKAAKAKTQTGSKAGVKKTNPESIALARYAGARTGTFNTYLYGPGGSSYYGPNNYSGHHHPFSYGSPYYYGGYYSHGVLLGHRPFFFGGFGTVTFHH